MQPPSLAKSSSQLTKWKPYKSWRYPRDLLRSIPQMPQQELDLNLVEINLCAYYNPDVLQMLDNKMVEEGFYLRSRHVLENLVNTYSRQKGLSEKISAIAKRFDFVFVNGIDFGNQGAQTQNKEEKLNEEEEKGIMKEDISQYKKVTQQKTASKIYLSNKPSNEKQAKTQFIAQRQKFILQLSSISDKLFECKQGKTQEEINHSKRKIFTQSLEQLNMMILQSSENCPVKQLSQEFQKKVNLQGQALLQKSQSISTPYVFSFKHQLHAITHISIPNSSFIPTKNRNPLKLDFGFSQFIYKNDDQLAHEIIAMQFIKYMNKIFCAEYVQQYEIMPEVRGAFYECVQAKTVAQVKKQHQDLSEYFKVLAEHKKVDINVIQKRFAQSYAGYCIAEFMLEIKDRNNANIMLKDDGTFFHIDLAFIFNAKPGGISFQSAPFKMTKQYVKAMGGFESDNFKYFQSLLIQIITKIYESKEQFLCKLDILGSRSKEIRCFNGFDIQKYRNTKIVKSLEDARSFVENLIDESFDNWRTKKYDTYQWKTNKIPA